MASDKLFGSIPPGWQYKTLGLACAEGGGDIQTGPFGSLLHASDYVPVGIPSIMPQNIGDNRIVEKGIARITAEDAQRLSRYILRDGDIVYSRRGDVERRALVRSHEDGWLCGTGCLRVRLGEQGADPRFVSLYLGHPSVREWIVRHAHGATMPNLNTSILSACPFLEPPLEEQRAIAHILGTLDDKIELNRKQNETLEAMARALFKAWFVDFEPVRAKMEGRWQRGQSLPGLPAHLYDLFPDQLVESEIGEIPEGWEVSTLGKVSSYLSRGISPKYIDAGGVLVLNQKCIRGFAIDFNKGRRHDVTQRGVDGRALEVGDVLVNSTGVGTLGRVAQVRRLAEQTVVDSHVTVVRSVARINPAYLCGFMYMKQPEIEAMGEGSTGQTELSRSKLGAMEILIPSISVLQEYAKLVGAMAESQAQNQDSSDALVSLRDTLLPKLISGELRVSSLNEDATP